MKGAKEYSIRVLSVAVVIIMLLCNISVIGFTGQSVDSIDEGSSNIDYDVVATNVDEAIYEPIYNENGECVEYKLVRGVNGVFSIPDTYKGKPVTVIGPRAFYHFENLGPIQIGPNVREICDEAFAYSSIPSFHRQYDNIITFGERVFAESNIGSITLCSNDQVLSERGGYLFFNLLLNTRNLSNIIVNGTGGPLFNPVYDEAVQQNILCYDLDGVKIALQIASNSSSLLFNSDIVCNNVYNINGNFLYVEGLFNWCTKVSDMRVEAGNSNLSIQGNGNLLVNNNRIVYVKPIPNTETIILPDGLDYNFTDTDSNPFAWIGGNHTFISESDEILTSIDGKELIALQSVYVVPEDSQFSVLYCGKVIATSDDIAGGEDSGIIFDSERNLLSITSDDYVTVLALKNNAVEVISPSSVEYDLTGSDTIEIVKIKEYMIMVQEGDKYVFNPLFDDPTGIINLSNGTLTLSETVDSFVVDRGKGYEEIKDDSIEVTINEILTIHTKTHAHFNKVVSGENVISYSRTDGSLNTNLVVSEDGSVTFTTTDPNHYYVSSARLIQKASENIGVFGDFGISFEMETTPTSFSSFSDSSKAVLMKIPWQSTGVLYNKSMGKQLEYLQYVSNVFLVESGVDGIVRSSLTGEGFSVGITESQLDSWIAEYSSSINFVSLEASYVGTPEQVPCHFFLSEHYSSDRGWSNDSVDFITIKDGIITVPDVFVNGLRICGVVKGNSSINVADASQFIIVEDLETIDNVTPSMRIDVPSDSSIITVSDNGSDLSFSLSYPEVHAFVVYVSGIHDEESDFISYNVENVIDGIDVDYNQYVFATVELDTLVLPVIEEMDQWKDLRFTYADNVDTLVIPEGTKYFGSNILDAGSLYSMKVRNIILPSSITHFNADTIQDFNELRQIIIDDSCSAFFTVDGCVYGHYDNNAWQLLMVPNSKAGCFIIPDEVSYIAPSAFSGTSVKTIYIGSNMERIGLYAFEDCYNLETVVIPNNVRYIMGNAFSGCVGLKTVVIGDGLCQLYDEVFDGCLSLKNVIIGNLNPETIDIGKPGYVYGYWAAGYADDSNDNNQKGYETLWNEYGSGDGTSVMMKALRVGNNVFPEGVTVTFANGQTWAHVDYKSVNTTGLKWNESYVQTDSDYNSKGVIFSLSPVDHFQSAEEMNFHWMDNGNDVWNSLSEYYVLVNDSTEKMVMGAVSGNGSITTDGTKYYFEPMSGWALSNVIIDGVPMGTMESFTPDLKDRDITIHAIFVEKRGYTPISEMKDYLQKSKYGIQFSADYSQISNEPMVLDNEIFSGLLVDNKTLSYSINEGINCKYVWTFDGMGSMNEQFIDNIDSVRLDMKIDEGEATVNDVEKAIPLNFSASGQLPYESTIMYYVGDEFVDGSTVQVSYVNENGERSETQSLQVENGYIHMRISHCSNYVIVGSSEECPDSPEMSLDCTTRYVLMGESVSFSVHLSAKDVSGLAVEVSYDPSIFELESYDMMSGTVIESMENNRFVMAWTDPIDLDSVVLTFTLKALAIAQNTAVSVELRFSEDNILGTSTVGINVVDYPRGDLTGDRLVTSNDAIYLLYRFMYGDEEFPLNQNPDFDGDGKFTVNDVIYLLYYSMFPESGDYPLH